MRRWFYSLILGQYALDRGMSVTFVHPPSRPSAPSGSTVDALAYGRTANGAIPSPCAFMIGTD